MGNPSQIQLFPIYKNKSFFNPNQQLNIWFVYASIVLLIEFLYSIRYCFEMLLLFTFIVCGVKMKVYVHTRLDPNRILQIKMR